MVGGSSGGGRTEQKGKRAHGHGQQCGNFKGERSIRRLDGNGKLQLKILKRSTNWYYKIVTGM